MAPVSALPALLERVQAATGPDRELDAAIVVMFSEPLPRAYLDGGEKVRGFIASHVDQAGIADHYGVALYTASIDAAVALVERCLPGSEWSISHDSLLDKKCIAGVWQVGDRQKPSGISLHRGATPPIAIIAALLSALIAREVPA